MRHGLKFYIFTFIFEPKIPESLGLVSLSYILKTLMWYFLLLRFFIDYGRIIISVQIRGISLTLIPLIISSNRCQQW